MPTPNNIRRNLRLARHRLLSRRQWRTRLVFWCGAILVGIVATGFASLGEMANTQFRHWRDGNSFLPLILTPLGMVGIVWLMRNYFRGAEGSGIPQAMAALQVADKGIRRRLLSLRIAIGKLFLTLGGFLSGASIGSYGPTIHISAAIMHTLGGLARFRRHDLERGLILAGSAAGIAAAFHAPLAGIIYAIEEMSRSFEERINGTLLTAVFIAGVTSLILTDNATLFALPAFTPVTMDTQIWLAAPLAGVLGGLLGGLFSLGLINSSTRLLPRLSRHPLKTALVCGLVIALLGLIPGTNIHGTGIYETQQLISGEGETHLFYPLLKLLATIAAYLSGIPGGLFAPTLSIGAGLGADLSTLFPGVPVATLVVLGITGYFAGVTQTPITAFVIVMELTGNRELLLPLIATAFIAHAISRIICPRPLYRTLALPFCQPVVADNEDKSSKENS